MIPRGLRLNNPLNIRHGNSQWQGRAMQQRDKEFVCFLTKGAGYRAGWKILQTYYTVLPKEGKTFCIRNIITRWAPPQDNNPTEAYIRRVVSHTGLPDNHVLPEPCSVGGFSALQPIMVAMTCVENGIKPDAVPTGDIYTGYKMAFPEVKLAGKPI